MNKMMIFGFCILCSHLALADEALFIELDINSDGLISIEEAAADATVSAKFSELDLDKDGFISLEEFENV